MPRKVYIKKEICEHTLKTAAEEFYKHNKLKGWQRLLKKQMSNYN